jgi:hypothetical protein
LLGLERGGLLEGKRLFCRVYFDHLVMAVRTRVNDGVAWLRAAPDGLDRRTAPA